MTDNEKLRQAIVELAEKIVTVCNDVDKLRAENERLREALAPFVSAEMSFRAVSVIDGTPPGEVLVRVVVSATDIDRARAVMEGRA